MADEPEITEAQREQADAAAISADEQKLKDDEVKKAQDAEREHPTSEEPGQPPAAEVKAESEALTHKAPEGQEPSSQEDLEGMLDPAAPTVKDSVDLAKKELPAFHPQIATEHDDYADHERPAIDPKEIS